MEDSRIIEVLESWKGTKWMHGVALKGYRADCGQFLLAVFKELGWLNQEHKVQTYNRQRALHDSCALISEEISRAPEMKRIDIQGPFKVGDVFIFKPGRGEGHVGMYIGQGQMIHCSIKHGVEEIQMNHPTLGGLFAAWRRET